MKIGLGGRWITGLALMPAASLAWASLSSAADVDALAASGSYLGAFGGVGVLGEVSMQQVGTVITPHPFPAIAVDARGDADRVGAPIAGIQLGHDIVQWHFSQPGWGIGIAAEVEGLYLGAEPEGVLDINPEALGTQYVSLPISVGAVLVNAVFNLATPFSNEVIPYAGVGVGYGAVFVNDSNSTNPSEPGINHFNAEPDASGGALALQAKLGLKAVIASNWSLFTEYRHVSIAPTEFTFGRTDYPGQHLPTTKWNVDLGRQSYNLWVSGLSYRF